MHPESCCGFCAKLRVTHHIGAGRRLPRNFGEEYYSDTRNGPFVRADVTYLRQDFSTYLKVEKSQKPSSWHEKQRYDFFVRVRELTAKEANSLKERARAADSDYRKAIQLTLAGLTSGDGETAALMLRLGLKGLSTPKQASGLR